MADHHSRSPDDHRDHASRAVADLPFDLAAELTSGATFWTTVSADEAGIPSVMMTDGPHGIRKQLPGADAMDLSGSVPAVCFPPAVAMASSFDPDLIERVGNALGEECLAEDVAILLGPGINIKRSLLGGRNFEYMSEDPFLAGRIGAAIVRGVQRHGIGMSLKHFAVNNQEHDRMRVSADVDPRPLREIYLRAFEHIVRTEQPWTVMASYNRINGAYATESGWLLSDTLRGRWGFRGVTVSDWGAVDDRVAALRAGLDLEMPSSGGQGPRAVVAACAAGDLDPELVRTAATRIAGLAMAGDAAAIPDASYDREVHHRLAREVAARCAVLLKNDRIESGATVLPLEPTATVAVIGEFARTPRYQGGGSSKINPFRLDNALDEIRAVAGAKRVRFAPGFVIGATESDDDLIADAVAAARAADTAVVFCGLGDAEESEGFDRSTWLLSASQTELVARVVAANPRTAVVLSNGGVVDIAGVDAAPAILEGWLLGQAGGGAIADLLYGVTDPSGRLAETIPMRIEDSPAYLDFPGELSHVRYGEGVFVGYRWYDARRLPVRYPFGHGLSYTAMELDDLSVNVDEAGLRVRCSVRNVGDRAGRAVVQLYLGMADSVVARPPREFKGVATAALEPGADAAIEMDVPRGELAYWHRGLDDWAVEGGEYRVDVGFSSRDIRLSATVPVEGDEIATRVGLHSTVAELLATTAGAEFLAATFGGMVGDDADPELMTFLGGVPVGRLAAMAGMDRDALTAELASSTATPQSTE